jgi:A/G-specific adenine glycosylase
MYAVLPTEMPRSTRNQPRNPGASGPSAALPGPLEAWFAGAARDLPWRRRRSGYRALVSEFMLQQTQVSRVVEKFEPFLRAFPTPAALAAASEDEVLAAWQGLGYYRRARLLHAAAKAIVERHGGRVPSDPAALRELPGVGRYTSGAIASIAFGAREPIVDGNVIRVLSRTAARQGSADDRATVEWAWDEASRFVEAASEPGPANEALMELGATVCTPAAPKCHSCPVARLCAAHRTGMSDRIPAPKRRAARRELVLVTARVERADGAVLLEQRPRGGLWSGLWQPPSIEDADGESLSPAAAAKALGLALALVPAGTVPFATTHRAVRFVVLDARVRGKGDRLASGGRRWVLPGELPKLALSNAAKRVLDHARSNIAAARRSVSSSKARD